MPNTVNSYIETDLGNVSPNPRGEYNAKYDYEYLDLIYYKGGSYLCLAPLGETIKNVPPIVGQTTTNWQCVAIPGDLTPEYISMYNEVVKDYNETNTNTADVAQMKDITYASMTAAQESESKASTSETNARNSEVNAKQSMDKAKEYSDEAIRVNNDTQSLVTGFDEHVATAISNAEASISESTDNVKGEIVAQKSSSLNEFRTDAETVMTNEKNVAVAEIHQMVDDFSADADSKKQEVIQVADEKINAMTALKNDAVNAKNAAETAATTAVEKASETATYAGEAKSSSDSAKANADLVSANKIEIDNAKSDVDAKVEQFESDLETYSVRTLRSDMTELQKETSDGFSALKGDLSNKITKFYASNLGKTNLSDSDNGKIQDMIIYGKSSQDGVPTPENPVEIKSVVNPTVKVSNEDGTQFKTVTLPYTLNAIPVESGGNVTIDGQQYTADYVDVDKKQLVRMVDTLVFDGSELWELGSINDYNIANFVFHSSRRYKMQIASNRLPPQNSLIANTKSEGIYVNENYLLFIRLKTDRISTTDALKTWLSENNIVALTALYTPTTIDLTDEEFLAFKALTTHYPTTSVNVTSDQLDGYTTFNYPLNMKNGWDYIKEQLGDTREYIYDMELQSAEAYVNSEYAVTLTELEV